MEYGDSAEEFLNNPLFEPQLREEVSASKKVAH